MTMDTDDVRRRLAHAVSGRLVVFTGAGLSQRPPSDLPLSRDLLRESCAVIRGVLRSETQGVFSPELESLVSKIPTLALEHFLEILAQIAGPDVLRLMSAYRGGNFNRDHATITRLVASNPSAWLFTLNFDCLLEQAVAAVTAKSPRTIATVEEFQECDLVSRESDLPVLHLHGALTGASASGILGTLSSVRTRLHRARARLLRRAVEDSAILCLGYSNGDVDTFPILQEGRGPIFWYTHSGYLPTGVTSASRDFSGRLSVLRRCAGENGIEDVLVAIRPDLANPGSTSTVGVDDSGQPAGWRLDAFREELNALLGARPTDRVDACKFVLANVSADLGHYDVARRLLPVRSRQETISANALLIHGHLSDLLGDRKSATRSYKRIASLQTDDKIRTLARLRQASAALGNWKTNPLRLLGLARWVQTISSQAPRDLVAGHRTHFEVGDFYQFVAEVLLVPANAAAAHCPWVVEPPGKLIRLADWAFSKIFGSWRRGLLRQAAAEYLRVIRCGRLPVEDPAPGYTVLAQLRYIECRTSLGGVPSFASGWMDEAERYYGWAKSAHGRGNVWCTRAIVATAAGDPRAAEGYLSSALEEYGSHAAGLRKVAICRQRNLQIG